MNKELFDEIYVSTDSDPAYKMRLTYYLLTDNIREEYCDLQVYGAEIDKESIYNDGSRCHESKIMRELFFRRDEAEEFIRRLARATVTPMGLKFAVKEHIGEQLNLIDC